MRGLAVLVVGLLVWSVPLQAEVVALLDRCHESARTQRDSLEGRARSVHRILDRTRGPGRIGPDVIEKRELVCLFDGLRSIYYDYRGIQAGCEGDGEEELAAMDASRRNEVLLCLDGRSTGHCVC